MVEIVQRMEHHSLANARLDIMVNSAKYQVSAIFKNVLDVFFSPSIYILERILSIEFYFITMGRRSF